MGGLVGEEQPWSDSSRSDAATAGEQLIVVVVVD